MSNHSIIYFADPMCSWCWGAAPAITRLKEQYNDFNFELVMGGLRPYESRPLDAATRQKLEHHWQQIGDATGQSFDPAILQTSGFVYNTEAAARAVVTVKKNNPVMTFVFFEAVQKAFYAEVKNPHQLATYVTICENLGIDSEAFTRFFTSEEAKEAAEEEFTQAKTFYGITGFPTLLLNFGKKAKPIARGYMPYEQMQQNVEQILMKYIS